MRTKQFKAESKRLLDLMINSIYTHKEIFLRELISNASDAIDKLYYKALTENISSINRSDFAIDLTLDKEARTLTICDNGCGMNEEELEKNLGTIAKSGSLAFKKDQQEENAGEDIDIIGQFGVGFYSAFMVAKHITVCSKAYGSDEAFLWQSSGAAGYTVEPCEKETYGTTITLTIKEDTDEEHYSEFLESSRIEGLVKKYSNYIRYPIRMDVTTSRPKEGTEGENLEWEEVTENKTLNSMVPLWKKRKADITPEEYNQFYQEIFMDFTAPAKVIHTSVEGLVSYHALLFIPDKVPFNYYSRDYEKGLQLYSNGVLIMNACKDLLPDYFSFVKGLVDSQELSLNISREMLQHDRQLKMIASSIEKKIKSELAAMLKEDRQRYEAFFKNFGAQLKYGLYASYGAKKDLLLDLLLFYSDHENGYTTLEEYASRMPEDQKYLYYAYGESPEKIAKLPQTELVRDKGYEILYLSEDVDEFVLQVIGSYQEKEFRNVSGSDLGLESEEEEKELEQKSEESREMLDLLKKALEGKVSDVRLSKRLKSNPVCLVSDGGLSIGMEKVLAAMPGQDGGMKAQYVLEINPAHPVFKRLTELSASDQDKLKSYAALLLDQAMLIEGLPIADPVAFSNAVCELM